MITSPRGRALMRAAGQLGLLSYAVDRAFSEATLLTWCQGAEAQVRTDCAQPVTMAQLHLETLGALAAALLGWWSTCRSTRAAWLAPLCAGLIIADWASSSVGHSSSVESLSRSLVVYGPLGLLVLSYLARSRLAVREASVSAWVWIVLLPLAGLRALIHYLPVAGEFPLPLLVDLIGYLVAGALYAGLRWRHPVPGAASWSSTTVVLAALTLPAYATLAMREWRGDELDNGGWAITSWWIAFTVVATLAALRWTWPTSRRRASGGPLPTDADLDSCEHSP